MHIVTTIIDPNIDPRSGNSFDSIIDPIIDPNISPNIEETNSFGGPQNCNSVDPEQVALVALGKPNKVKIKNC